MGGLRDYEQWHREYDDPGSDLSWRLGKVRRYITAALDERAGPVRALSLCAGDGRDLLGVLSARGDADRVEATLVEIHQRIAEAAREAAAGLSHVRVLTADAAEPDLYAGAVPVDLVLLVGIFGNISDGDIRATVAAAPQLCRPGATLIWSRGRRDNDDIRSWFAEAGFTEVDYASLASAADRADRSVTALGVVRYDGPPQPLIPGQRLFTFLR